MTLVLDLTCPMEVAEIISDRLWALGVMGIEELSGDDACTVLRTTLGEDRREAETRVAQLLSDLPNAVNVSVRWHEISNDIAETWRNFAQPVSIGTDLVIVPAWLPAEEQARRPDTAVITIEPGATFGLGDHPTTRACLQLVKETVQLHDTVLDIGCGSGILGIAALIFGAGAACGIDINPAAEAVSTANAAANGVGQQWSVRIVDLDDSVVDELLEHQPGGFDLVTANILAPVLIGLAPFFHRLLAAEGKLIIGGVLTMQYDHVERALAPLQKIDEHNLEGWAAATYRREHT